MPMTNCVLSSWPKNRDGYGLKRINRRKVLHHRVVYVEHHNLTLDDIKDQVVRHACDNAACINPEHLLLGSQQDNVVDAVARGRVPKGERHWASKLTADQVAEIRARRAKGEQLRPLASEFGVAFQTISDIARGRSWK